MKIAVVGLGYVGMSNAILLSQFNQVVALEIDQEKIDKINNNLSTIDDEEIIDFLKNKNLNLIATKEKQIAYENADYVIVATPTDYNPETNNFDTNSVESVIADVMHLNRKAVVVIKSTVPVGFTHSLKIKMNYEPFVIRKINYPRVIKNT